MLIFIFSALTTNSFVLLGIHRRSYLFRQWWIHPCGLQLGRKSYHIVHSTCLEHFQLSIFLNCSHLASICSPSRPKQYHILQLDCSNMNHETFIWHFCWNTDFVNFVLKTLKFCHTLIRMHLHILQLAVRNILFQLQQQRSCFDE